MTMKKVLSALLAATLLAAAPGIMAKSSNKTQVAQNLNIFNEIYKELHINYVDSLDADKNIRNAIDAMLVAIDPYTEYYPVTEQEDLLSISSGEFGGIGSIIMMRNGKVILSQPQWNSPARNAGIRHGDVILAIDGDTVPEGFTSTEATKLLRGQAGTKVTVKVQRPYVSDSIKDIEITRGIIRTNPVPYYGMVNDSIGYIDLVTFNEKAAQKVKEAMLELKKNKKMKGLILDLRNNGGGLLEQAVQIVGFFVPKGTVVVTTKYRNPKEDKTYKTTQSPIEPNLPLVVLINNNTASAAEIVSGALQDLDRAVIVGDRSFGKGLVQTSRPLPYDGMLKLTVARYYIPSGRLIQAIDYSHRNPDGSVARIPDSLTNVYHTAVGREVRDGGGITPDIKVTKKDMNRLIYNIISDFWAYDYANRFAARQGNRMPEDGNDFVVTDSIFEDFKAFIDPEKFRYDRACDAGLKYLREAAETEGYMNDSVQAQIDALEALLRHDLSTDFEINRDDIVVLLDSEITSRYYDDAIQVKRSLLADPDMDAATAVLSDPRRYRKLLSPNRQ